MRSFFDAAPEVSKDVPMLIGSVSEEGNQMSSRPTEQEWHASLAKTYGEENATAIMATLKKLTRIREYKRCRTYVPADPD
jgi:para-nitrobenzyl esterase